MTAPVLLDLDGEPIDIWDCNCDLDAPCSGAKCLMERDFEMRSMARWYRNQIVQGFDPAKTYAENVS